MMILNKASSDTKSEEIINDLFRKYYRLPPDLTMDVWADENRRLSSKESALDGRWKTSRTPYLREPMICLSPSHSCQIVAVMGGTQSAKSELVVTNNGYSIDQDPCAMMNVLPGGTLSGDFSIQRLKSMIENTPCVREKMTPDKKRDASSTIGRKEFDNGILFTVTGMSELNMISRPLKKVNIDEPDQMGAWVLSMADDRMRTYKPYNKLLVVGTPKRMVSSVIYLLFKNGDQRYYYLACPSCEFYQILEWNNIMFDRDDHYNLDSEVTYACKENGCQVSEYDMKYDMENRAEYRPHNQENGQHPSFYLPQYYSTLGDASWESAVKKFLTFTKLKSEKNPMYLELQEAWTNSVLGWPWKEPDVGEALDWEVLYGRREDYSMDMINENILAIVCGVDVQGDRIEASTIGIGLNYQAWAIEYKYLYGDVLDPALWAHLDTFLRKTYKHPKGNMSILGAALDTGYKPDEVCEYVRTRGKRNVFAIKGSSLRNQPIICNRSKNKGTDLYSVGTDTAKTKIASFLKIAEPGPGYVHFSLSLPKLYFQQLTAEKKKSVWNAKERKYLDVWVNPNKARNEALDNFVYSLAALNILRMLYYPNNNVKEMLEHLAEQMKTGPVQRHEHETGLVSKVEV